MGSIQADFSTEPDSDIPEIGFQIPERHGQGMELNADNNDGKIPEVVTCLGL